VCFAMTTETEQLLILLRSIAQAKPLTQKHRALLLDTLGRSTELAKRGAWSVLPSWQCERLWEIVRSGR
jgi:hypothetical protein